MLQTRLPPTTWGYRFPAELLNATTLICVSSAAAIHNTQPEGFLWMLPLINLSSLVNQHNPRLVNTTRYLTQFVLKSTFQIRNLTALVEQFIVMRLKTHFLFFLFFQETPKSGIGRHKRWVLYLFSWLRVVLICLGITTNLSRWGNGGQDEKQQFQSLITRAHFLWNCLPGCLAVVILPRCSFISCY